LEEEEERKQTLGFHRFPFAAIKIKQLLGCWNPLLFYAVNKINKESSSHFSNRLKTMLYFLARVILSICWVFPLHCSFLGFFRKGNYNFVLER
jgi:predicted nucleotidyltransferase